MSSVRVKMGIWKSERACGADVYPGALDASFK